MSIPEEYRLALEMQEKESDRYWNRSNVILLIQGALATVLGSQIGKPGVALVIGFVGLTLSLLWLGVLHKGKLYVKRWSDAAERVEEESLLRAASGAANEVSYPIISYYESSKAAELRPRFILYRYNTTTLMKFAVFVMVAYWVVVDTSSITKILFGSAPGASTAPVPTLSPIPQPLKSRNSISGISTPSAHP